MTRRINFIGSNIALIGYTGFVGGNILKQKKFDHLYNSKNIEDIQGRYFDLIVCSGAYGVKWEANKNPEKDSDSIEKLVYNLEKVKTKKFILISTVDIYPTPSNVDEDTTIEINELLPYGKHRRILELFAESIFTTTIIRLPTIFGIGLRKNIIFDFINKSYTNINQNSVLQLYALSNIWDDICNAIIYNLKVINMATEPIAVTELAKEVFDMDFINDISEPAPNYDVRTKFGKFWGKDKEYLYSKNSVLNELKSFVALYDSNGIRCHPPRH